MRFAIALLGAMMVAPAMAQAPTSGLVSDEERTALDGTAERGRLLAAYDRVAWLGTDDVQKRLPDWQSRLGGWIVDGPASAPTLLFHDRSQPPRALYTARLVAGELTDPRLVTGDDAVLSADRLRLIAARAAATAAMNAAGLRPCSTAFNTVVVPPEGAGDAIAVYFLSAQKQANDMPIGGHFRVDVAADGVAGKPFAFSKGCMTLPPPTPEQKDGIGFVTTLTAPLPNETHSFTVEAYRRPLVVMIPGPPERAFALIPGRPIRPIALPPLRDDAGKRKR